ncbi:Mur ligase family protein [Nitratireductor sp. ZSWI3]|uniref:Mur ligase family protein n=1 Tax=Nitratireductor sp. ZSWI3 TaxID=2966359 RepID=UPI0021501BCE|nr:Mur ligase family protein [Nitratireductor sp. ZSWI3]MCR4268469.1 Mur ligase family protein [Nitratireductor sp. ZSWI3]
MSAGIRKIARRLREASRPWRRRYSLRSAARRAGFLAALQLARLNRRRLRARIVAVTGSSGKSTTVSLLSHILQSGGSVHTQVLENTLPILPHTLNSAPAGTDFLVAELGVTKVGSMAPMARLLRPHVAVVTKIGLEHYSSFRSKETIAAEKGVLVEGLPDTGMAILNADDPNVMAMTGRTRATIVTFGWSDRADYRVIACELVAPARLHIRIDCSHGSFDITAPFIGNEFWLATAAAFATAVELGVAPADVVRAFVDFTPLWDRCTILATDGGPRFIIDTVKAPNESIPAAIALLDGIEAPRKRAVIGHIADYSGNPKKPYRNAYALARAAADQVIFVGDNIHRSQAPDEERQAGIYVGLATTREAADHIRNTAEPGELILLKGARNYHLERIALAWTREVRCWEQVCGLSMSCLQCGMVEVPYKEHRGLRRAARRGKWAFWRRGRRGDEPRNRGRE